MKGRLAHQAASLQDRDVATGPNAAIAQEVLKQVSQCGTEVDRLLQDAENRIAAALNQLAGAGSRLATSHKQQEMEFRSLIEQHQQAQGQAAERAQLERRRNDLLAKNRQRQQLADQLAALDANRKTLLERLSELWDERFAVREGVAQRINAHLTPSIRVSISQYGNPERYQKLLEDGLKGARLKHVIVAQKLANAFWPGDLVDGPAPT